VKKKLDGTIVNMLTEFRLLKKILDSEVEGVPKQRIVENVTRYLKSKTTKDVTGKTKTKAMAMEEVYEKTSYAIYTEKDIVKTSKTLLKLLEKINYSEVKDKKAFKNALNDLADKIDDLLDN